MPAAKLPKSFQQMTYVALTDEERNAGTINNEHLGEAVSAMHRDGIVVLENAVNLENADKLNRILVDEANEMAKLPTTHFNENSTDGKPTGNMSQGPVLDPDFMYTDVWANGPAAAVMECLLGPNPRVNFVNGNTALGGFNGARQNVHADLAFNFASFPWGLVTNYYLTDVGTHNGGTELWLGTHRDTTFADHKNCVWEDQSGKDAKKMEVEFGIRPELLEQRREFAPPIQAVVKKGSVIVRDLRLWHAGLCNPSPEARIMLAFVHTPHWYECPSPVILPASARPLVEQWRSRPRHPVAFNAMDSKANKLDHMAVKFTPNFSSENPGYQRMLPELPPGYTFGMTPEEKAEVERNYEW